VAGTPVLTADGTKPIEDIAVGDKVWTRNLATGLDELQLVAETFVHQTVALYHLTINGERVSTTAEHPFMVQDKGWQMAGNLRPGDILITPDGTTNLQAVEVEERDLADIVEVYNFHVENNLNYYVHAGNTPVLVHNTHSGGADDVAAAAAQTPKTMDDVSDAAYQGVLHVRDEIAREGPGGSHSWAAKMSDDELATYFDDFATSGTGKPMKDGSVGWYDPDRGVMVNQRSEYSMTGRKASQEDFDRKLEK
jgi:hypothetical protein